MTRDHGKSKKVKIAILTFDCEIYDSLGLAFHQAKKFSKSHIIGAREIWAVNKAIFWSEERQVLEEEEIDKVILYFFGEKYPIIEDLLSDPSLIDFLKCTKAKIFITEEKIPWPENKDEK
jgi:hypothetical protein